MLLHGHMSSFLLGRYLGVEMFGHVRTLVYPLEELPNYVFPKKLHNFTFLPAMSDASNFFSSLTFVIV